MLLAGLSGRICLRDSFCLRLYARFALYGGSGWRGRPSFHFLAALLLQGRLCLVKFHGRPCTAMHGFVNGLRPARGCLLPAASCSLLPARPRGHGRERLRRGHEAHGLHRIMMLGLFHDSRHLAERAVRRRPDGIEHGLVDRLEDAALILEFELALLRMHVDVNRALRHLDVDHGQREAALRDQRLIGVVNGFRDCAVLDDARIDDVRLPGAAALEHRRFRDVARDVDFLAVERQCEQGIGRLAPVDGADGVEEIAVARRHDGYLIVVDELERDIGAREGQFDDEIVDLAALRMRRLEEFLACRRVEEEILNLDRRAKAAAGLADIGLLPAADIDARAEVLAFLPRQQGKARD